MHRILHWLYRHFIPHMGNAYRPHFFLGKNVTHLLGVVFGFEMLLFILPVFNFPAYLGTLNLSSVLPTMLTTFTNAERASNQLPELRENALLNRAAELKAGDMASRGYFAHVSPDGKTPWYWFDLVGYKYFYAGENLAVNFVDSEAVTRAWMNSPTHRANITQLAFTEIGTGVATGTFNGAESVFVAQVYARPRAANSNPQPASAISVFEQVASSPKEAIDVVLYTILAIVVVALLANILIKIRKQHPDLIMNGAIVVAVILGLHYLNNYITHTKGLQTSFIAFDQQGIIE